MIHRFIFHLKLIFSVDYFIKRRFHRKTIYLNRQTNNNVQIMESVVRLAYNFMHHFIVVNPPEQDLKLYLQTQFQVCALRKPISLEPPNHL